MRNSSIKAYLFRGLVIMALRDLTLVIMIFLMLPIRLLTTNRIIHPRRSTALPDGTSGGCSSSTSPLMASSEADVPPSLIRGRKDHPYRSRRNLHSLNIGSSTIGATRHQRVVEIA